jgi:hypothetical protein
VTITVLVLALVHGAHSVRADAGQSTSAPPTATFHDAQGNLTVTVHFDTEPPTAADYDLEIAGVGDVTGSAPLTEISPTAGEIAAANAPAEFIPSGGSSPQSSTLTMTGHVDLVAETATLVIVFQGSAYTLLDSPPSPSAAPVQAMAAMAAVMDRQWGAAYGMLAFEEQAYESQSQFIAGMSQPGPTVTQVQLGANGTSETIDGVMYWHQPMVIMATPSGGTSSPFSVTVDLVAEGGQWRLVDTSPPLPA